MTGPKMHQPTQRMEVEPQIPPHCPRVSLWIVVSNKWDLSHEIQNHNYEIIKFEVHIHHRFQEIPISLYRYTFYLNPNSSHFYLLSTLVQNFKIYANKKDDSKKYPIDLDKCLQNKADNHNYFVFDAFFTEINMVFSNKIIPLLDVKLYPGILKYCDLFLKTQLDNMVVGFEMFEQYLLFLRSKQCIIISTSELLKIYIIILNLKIQIPNVEQRHAVIFGMIFDQPVKLKSLEETIKFKTDLKDVIIQLTLYETVNEGKISQILMNLYSKLKVDYKISKHDSHWDIYKDIVLDVLLSCEKELLNISQYGANNKIISSFKEQIFYFCKMNKLKIGPKFVNFFMQENSLKNNLFLIVKNLQAFCIWVECICHKDEPLSEKIAFTINEEFINHLKEFKSDKKQNLFEKWEFIISSFRKFGSNAQRSLFHQNEFMKEIARCYIASVCSDQKEAKRINEILNNLVEVYPKELFPLIIKMAENHTISFVLEKILPTVMRSPRLKSSIVKGLIMLKIKFPRMFFEFFSNYFNYLTDNKGWSISDYLDILNPTFDDLIAKKLDSIIIRLSDDNSCKMFYQLIFDSLNADPKKFDMISKLITYVENLNKLIGRQSYFCEYLFKNLLCFTGETNVKVLINMVFDELDQVSTNELLHRLELSGNDEALRKKIIEGFEEELDLWVSKQVKLRRLQSLFDFLDLELKRNQMRSTAFYALLEFLFPDRVIEFENLINEYAELQNKSRLTLDIIERTCLDCQDVGSFKNQFILSTQINRESSFADLLNNLNMNEIYKELEKWRPFLVEDFWKTELSANKMIETCQNRISSIIEKGLKFKQKMNTIFHDLNSCTIVQIKDLFQIDDENRLKTMMFWFIDLEKIPERKNIMMALDFAFSRKIIHKYVSLFHECLEYKFFEFRSQQNSKIEICNSLNNFFENNPEEVEMEQFISFSHIFCQNFDELNRVPIIIKSLSFLIDFNEPMQFLERAKGAFDILKESVIDDHEFSMHWKDIDDLEVVQNFMHELKANTDFYLLTHILNGFEKIAKSNKLYVGIEEKILAFKKNFAELKEFYNFAINRTERKFATIKSLMEKSTIEVHVYGNKIVFKIGLESKFTYENQNLKSWTIESFGDLYNAIRMKTTANTNSMKTNTPKKSNDRLNSFLEMYFYLERLYASIKRLKLYGYIFSDAVEIFNINHNKFPELVSIIEKYEQLANKNEIIIHDAYRKSFLITFIREEDQEMIVNAIKSNIIGSGFTNLFKYMGIEENPNINNFDHSELSQQINQITLNEVALFCLEKLEAHSVYAREESYTSPLFLSSENIYMFEYLENAFDLNQRQVGNLLSSILQLSIGAYSRILHPHNILFCSPKTQIISIFRFLYRMFTCKNAQPFFIVNPQVLSLKIQQEFIDLYCEISKTIERKSIMILFYLGIDSYVISYFCKLPIQKSISANIGIANDLYNQTLTSYYQNTRLVISDKVLSGKTHFIRSEFDNKKREGYIYYSIRICGTIDLHSLFKGAEKVLTNKKVFLHIEIGQINAQSLRNLDEILFSLVVLKSIDIETKVFMVSHETLFYIEFDSSYSDVAFTALEFCRLGFPVLNVKNLPENQILPLSPVCYEFMNAVSTNNVKKFSNYLIIQKCVAFEDQSVQKIAIRNVNLNPREPFLRRKNNYSPQEISHYIQMIRNYCFKDVEQYEHCQIVMFEKIVNFLGWGFSESGFFDYDINGDENVNKIKIAQIILDSAHHLSVNALEILSREQNYQKDLYNQHQFGQEASIKELEPTSQTTIKDDNIIIFFVNAFPIFIYKKVENVPQILRDFDTNKERFIEYSKLGHSEFFKELSHMSNRLVTCIFCFTCSEKYYNDLCHQCRQFVSDSFCLFCNKPVSLIEQCLICKGSLFSAKALYDKNNSQIQLQQKIKKTVYESEINSNFLESIAQSIQKRYVITPDNYYKMLCIYVRAKARIPVLLMGETGCGKTSLIKFLCTFVLDDYFDLLNMHAGTDEQTIIEHVKNFINICKTYENSDCWLVFDEFNTSPAYGLIKTIMTDRKLENEFIPSNAIFVATCNPFRMKLKLKKNPIIGLEKGLHKLNNMQSHLQYTVKPVPDSMLFYTFDFGQLSSKDEKLYIQTLLQSSNLDSGVQQLIANLVVEGHQVLKEILGICSTSLRDFQRFLKIFKFFNESYFKRKYEWYPNFENQDPNKILHDSIILAFMMSYYFRLSDPQEQTIILQIVAKQLNKEVKAVENVFRLESEAFIKIMQLENWVIGNKALCENTFCMFICLLNKIPLIIIGKPGSSKSLSVELIFSNLKGSKSKIPFFKKFAELIIFNYQGSEYSTSEGIETIFSKAEDIMGKLPDSETERIAVVVFDEIGLAEISPSNPLKVLHSKLEIENIKVGFVGISNWHLDSSKMNRVLTISRSDPDLAELQNTAVKMSQSILNSRNSVFDYCFKVLAKVYYDIQTELQQKSFDYIYGLRDFYHMIKYVATQMEDFTKENTPTLPEIKERLLSVVMTTLMRNFSYQEEYCMQMWENFRVIVGNEFQQNIDIKKPEITDLIISNLADKNSRYLMIITDQYNLQEQIIQILQAKSQNQLGKKLVSFVGSAFDEDQTSETYCVDVVSQIIDLMDQEVIVTMQGLEKIYTSLYDLFNQNFTRKGDRNYCRIVQGTISNAMYPVNKNFKIILFLNSNELKGADSPLINRFEKYTVVEDASKFLRNENYQKVLRFLDTLFGSNNKQENVLKNIFANYSRDTIFSWVKLFDKSNISKNSRDDLTIIEENEMTLLTDLFLRTANLNFMIYLSGQKDSEQKTECIENFIQHKEITIFDLMRNVWNQRTPQKTIVHTFSVMYKDIIEHLSKNKNFEPMWQDKFIFEINFSVLKTQKDLINLLHKFFTSPTHKFLIVRMIASFHISHMNGLQNLIYSMEGLNNENCKNIFIIISYKPELLASTPRIPIYVEWNEYFIDDLFDPLSDNQKKLLLNPSFKMIIANSKKLFEQKFDEMIDKTYQCSSLSKNNLDDFKKYFSNFSRVYPEKIKKFIVKIILEACVHKIEESSNQTIFEHIRRRTDALAGSEKLFDAIDTTVLMYIQTRLSQFLNIINKEELIFSLYNFVKNKEEDYIELWIDLVYANITNKAINSQVLPTKEPRLLCFPFSQREFNTIMSCQQQENKSMSNMDDVQKFEDYKRQSLYSKHGLWRNGQKSDQIALLSADLIYLHIATIKKEKANSSDIKNIVEIVFKGRELSLLKSFVIKPLYVSTVVFVIKYLIDLLDKNFDVLTRVSNELSNPEETDIDTYSFNLIDTLIGVLIEKEVVFKYHEKIYASFYAIKKQITILERLKDRKFDNCDEHAIWTKLIKILRGAQNNTILFEDLFKNYKTGKSKSLEDKENFEALLDSLNRLKFDHPDLIQVDKINEFESFYMHIMIAKFIERDVAFTQRIFEVMFQKIETVEGWDSLSKKSLSKLLNLVYEETEEDYFTDLVFDKNYYEQNPYKIWLNEMVKQYAFMLPYLLAEKLTDIVRNKLDLEDLQNFRLFEISKVLQFSINYLKEDSLSYKGIEILAIARLILDNYTSSLTELTREPQMNEIRLFLNNSSPIISSYRIYVIKRFIKNRGTPFDDSINELSQIKDEWVKQFIEDLKHEDDNTNMKHSELVLSDYDDNFKTIDSYLSKYPFPSIGETSDFLLENKNQRTKEFLMAYYYATINRFYLCELNNQINAVQYFKSLENNREQFVEIFGITGFKFVGSILTNFEEGSPFRKIPGTSIGVLRRNANILNAFAVVLAQKYENNYLGSLLYSASQDKLNIMHELNNKFLPGMILNPNPAIFAMLELMERLPNDDRASLKVFQCGPSCSYYFIFENCGKPEGRGICPLCKTEIGAQSSHVALDKHIQYDKPTAIQNISNFIHNYQTSYRTGCFNLTNTAKLLNNYPAIPAFVINVLNFLSNSFLLVLYCISTNKNEFRSIVADNIFDLVRERLNDNFDMFKKCFSSVDNNVLINAIVTAIGQKFNLLGVVDIVDPVAYSRFENQINDQILSSYFQSPQKFANDYQILSHRLAQKNSKPSLKSITEEIDQACWKDPRYCALKHLRLSGDYRTFSEFSNEFFKMNTKSRAEYPLTNFVLENKDKFEKLVLVSMFKKFYDMLYRENGKIARERADKKLIGDYIMDINDKELQNNIMHFIKLWNEYWNDDEIIHYECQVQLAKKIDIEKDVLSTFLPNRMKGDKGTNILLSLPHCLKVQNDLLHLLHEIYNISEDDPLTWNDLHDERLFILNEKRISFYEAIINEFCVFSSCAYGQKATEKIEYQNFENFLVDAIFKVNFYVDDISLIPEFKYSFESNEMSNLLDCLKQSQKQIRLQPNELAIYTKIIQRLNEQTSSSYFASLFIFIESILLPRTKHAKEKDFELSVLEFINNNISKEHAINSPLKNDFENLRMTQLYSFVLLVEKLLFESKIDIENSFFIHLNKNVNDEDWVRLKKSITAEQLRERSEFLEVVFDMNVFKRNQNEYMDMIARSVIRTTSLDNSQTEYDLIELFSNNPIADIGENEENLCSLILYKKFQIKHVLLLYEELRKKFTDETKLLQPIQICSLSRNQDVFSETTSLAKKKVAISKNKAREFDLII